MSMSTHQRIRRYLAEKKKASLEQSNLEVVDLDKMSIPELKEYANARNISIAGIKKKEDIINQIKTAPNSNENDNTNDTSPDDKDESTSNEEVTTDESNRGTA